MEIDKGERYLFIPLATILFFFVHKNTNIRSKLNSLDGLPLIARVIWKIFLFPQPRSCVGQDEKSGRIVIKTLLVIFRAQSSRWYNILIDSKLF